MNSTQLASALLEDGEPAPDVDPKEYVMQNLKMPVMTVVLKSVGNPDFDEFHGHNVLSPTRKVKVKSYADAARICRKYIAKYDLGGGNWGRYGGDDSDNEPESGAIFVDKKKVARVSYNGRVWDLNNEEINITD